MGEIFEIISGKRVSPPQKRNEIKCSTENEWVGTFLIVDFQYSVFVIFF